MKIDNKFAAIVLIELLYKSGLINDATYKNVIKEYGQGYEQEYSHV